MSDRTTNLNLFKYNTTDLEDLNSPFNVQTALNDNWDKIDAFAANGGSLRNLSDTSISTSITNPSALVFTGSYWTNQTLTTVPIITSIYVSGDSGRVVYSTGWCKQWGVYASTATSSTVTLTKTFSNTNYYVLMTDYDSSSTDTGGIDMAPMVKTKATNSFTFSSVSSRSYFFLVEGYLAAGQY